MPALPTSTAARMTLLMACLFGVAGVTLVFLPRWLEVERQLSGAQIGAILSLAQGARILTGPAVAFWADGAADRRAPLRALAVAAALSYAAFFFLAHDFWSLLILGFVALSATQALTPLIEAATLRATAQGALSYGRARAIGSLAFILANVAGGVLIARFGIGAVVVWALTGLALTAAAATFALKPDPSPEPHAQRAEVRREASLTLLRSRRFVILVLACGLIQSAHAFYYGFSTIVWRAQGLSADLIGMLWAFGVAVEVGFLWSLAPIERRLSPETLILAGAGGAVLRWFAMGFAPTGLALWPLQALHALSFAAAHVGAMRLIYREAPESAAGMAQTLYAVGAGGVLMGASTFASGWLYDTAGAGGYWAMAAMAAAGGALALLLLPGRQ